MFIPMVVVVFVLVCLIVWAAEDLDDTHYIEKLQDIVIQLRFCDYMCEAGPLENNTSFIALVKLANMED